MGVFVPDGFQLVVGGSRERGVELPGHRRQIGRLIAGVELEDGSLWDERHEERLLFRGTRAPALAGASGRPETTPPPPAARGQQRAAGSGTHPSPQVLGEQRHQQAGRGQQRAPLRHQPHVHEAHLAVEPGQSQRVHACLHTLDSTQEMMHKPLGGGEGGEEGGGGSYLSVAAQESVRDGDVDVKHQRLQHAGLGGDKLLPPVGVVADVEEVLHAGGAALLRDRSLAAPRLAGPAGGAGGGRGLTSNLEAMSMAVEPTSCSISRSTGVLAR